MLKQGEMVLKGLNKSRFEKKLTDALKQRLAPLGGFDVRSAQSTVYVTPRGGEDIRAAARAVGTLFGVAAYTIGAETEKDLAAMARAAALFCGLENARSFKVEARRADKKFPHTSPEICAALGAMLCERYPHLRVDVHSPEVTVWAEVRESAAYIHTSPLKGAGGLPPGSSGKAVLLLSGGIDSPVAAYRAARRGLELVAVHFYSYPYTSEESLDKVRRLADTLGRWVGDMPLVTVPFTAVQERIRAKAPDGLATVLARRSMARIACMVAASRGCGALVTGESLGQVASQTLEALAITEQASSLPVFRPLLGMDKDEIVTTAREIGTFDISALPYEDCCAVFTPRHPKTKPRLASILDAELAGAWQVLEEEAAAAAGCGAAGEGNAGVNAALSRLAAAGKTLALAESCTGGLLASRVTARRGASAVFVGGVSAYSPEAKITLLGVPPETLRAEGAVSAATAEAMARGVCERLGAGYGIGITGIAGPDGDGSAAPAGTVYIALHDTGRNATVTLRERFAGSRESVRNQACDAALRLLIKHIQCDTL
ncbi:MAG: tRNA 4-thiouridine(8) synthase ThiI [Oscillospiraceae bacterium]|nr:tRNA 4-thiouridine(8) synthase ThiI [Oscillospiraceae bacterium]